MTLRRFLEILLHNAVVKLIYRQDFLVKTNTFIRLLVQPIVSNIRELQLLKKLLDRFLFISLVIWKTFWDYKLVGGLLLLLLIQLEKLEDLLELL